jgi:hypothetical protein
MAEIKRDNYHALVMQVTDYPSITDTITPEFGKVASQSSSATTQILQLSDAV